MGIARLFTQTASVETRTGSKAGAAAYADPVDVACFVNDSHKQVRAANGDEIVSSTTLYAPLADVEVFAPGSKVTVNGRTAFVISTFRRDSAGPASAFHTQADLT